MAGRDATIAAAVLLGATFALAGCGDHAGFAPRASATRVLAPIGASPRLVTSIPIVPSGAAAAIVPRRVTLPHAEIGGYLGHRPTALALQFTAKAGQVLEVKLEQAARAGQAPAAEAGLASGEADAGLAQLAVAPLAEPAREAGLRVLIVDGDVAPRYAELAAPAPGTSELFVRLPAAGEYVVQLRPPGTGLYRLALELRAPLPFPIEGYDYTAIKSYFGASRDAGERRHEGVDIFAPRLTPVIAVADGTVGLHVEGRGGIAVVLSIAGISYYYAHLDRTAVGQGEHVRIGDVLGYVGNTGNARGSPPHLHFGVYEFGKGAVDPLPLLEERRFETADDTSEPFAMVAAALADEAGAERALAGAQAPSAAEARGGGGSVGDATATVVTALAGACNPGFVEASGYGRLPTATLIEPAAAIGEWALGGESAWVAEGSGLWEPSLGRCR